MNNHGGIIPLNLQAETPQAFQRTLAIHTRGEIVDDGCAFSYGANHREPVTDGFIARHRSHSADSRGRPDFQTIRVKHYPQISTVIDFAKSSCYEGAMTLRG